MRKLLLASLLMASPVFAQQGTAYTVLGIGKLTCGKYVEEVNKDRAAVEAYSWWISGFITAANAQKARSIPTDSAAHDAWLKQYCEKNPLDSFVQAAIELNKELDKRAGK